MQPELKAFIDAVERLAFDMKPPNPYTPQFVQLCVEARTRLMRPEERRIDYPDVLRTVRLMIRGQQIEHAIVDISDPGVGLGAWLDELLEPQHDERKL